MSTTTPTTENEKLKSTARHLLTVIGTIVVALGIGTAENVDILVTAGIELLGAVLVIIAVARSWKNKDKLVDGYTKGN